MLALSLVSCAEAPVDEPAPVQATKAEPEPEGPYYELTKDDITTHEEWTGRNVTLLGVKIGDKTTAVQKTLGKDDATEVVGDHYRTVFEGSSYAVYTHKMTGELQKIEVFSRYADKIKDAKLKKLLSSGSLDAMREAFGMEEGRKSISSVRPTSTSTTARGSALPSTTSRERRSTR
jgi:hypothetical protein